MVGIGIVLVAACTSDIGNIEYYGDETPNPSNTGNTPNPTPSGSPPPTNPIVYLTSTTYTGDEVSSTIGGDAKCDLRAVASGLPGSYTAWLSDSNADAIDRIADPGGWQLFDGTLVFTDLNAVTAGPAVGITMDEYGNDLGSVEVWTGTSPDGTHEGTDCSAWNGGGQGHYGLSDATDTTWTSSGNGGCNTARHLYCFRRP